MPTFRKFLRQSAPRLLGSAGTNSNPSKPQSNTHDISQSRPRRQELSEYAQFDTVEMDCIESSDDGNREVPLGTTIRVTGPANKVVTPDDASEKAILDGNSIAYTTTFEVQYSK